MPDFPDGNGYFFYVPTRLLWNELCEVISQDYELHLIDDEDNYYIYEVSKD